MTLVAALLAALAAADLVRWAPDAASAARTRLALAAGPAAAVVLALATTTTAGDAALVAATGAAPALAWVLATSPRRARAGAGGEGRPLPGLVVLAASALAVAALLPLAPAPAGAAARWWDGAGAALPGLAGTGVGRALVAAAGLAFATASANRVVRLVLTGAGTPAASGEAALRGGRLLGPLERVFILALAAGGDLTAAAVVVAAKALLRLPEVRSARAQHRGEDDGVTEYFLVGTFTSWLVALAVAAVVAASR